MRYLLIILLCLSVPALAHYDEPSPAPKQTETPVYPSNHDDTGKAFLITAIVVGLGFWIYCHVTDKCKSEPVAKTDDDLNVTPSPEVLSDKKRQFVIEAQ